MNSGRMTTTTMSRQAAASHAASNGGTRWLLPGAALALAVVVGIAGAWAGSVRGPVGDVPAGQPGQAVIYLGFGCFALVGAVVSARRPRHPVGWLLLAYGVISVLNVANADLGLHAAAEGRWAELVALAAWLDSWLWAVGLLALARGMLLFPDGRLPSQRWRVLTVAGVGCLLLLAVMAVLLWPDRSPELLLVGVDYPDPAGLVADVAFPVVTLTMVASIFSVLLRLRRADAEQRLQIKWLLFAAAFMAAGMIGLLVTGSAPGRGAPAAVEALMIVGIVGMPISIGVAILRYRLYEIDRIISRTVGYGLVTGILALVYVLGVLLLGQLFASDSQLAVAGSTLAVAAAFGPVRRRVQTLVDRRFNRARYDAQRTVTAFSARLREDVDLDGLRDDLLAVVDHTVQPSRASLWLKAPSGGVSR